MSERNGTRADITDRWALVQPHRDRLLAIARARCSDIADAEDCVQEAMLRVVEFPALDPARVGQLLTSVTVRLAADTHRERARSRRAGLAMAVAEVADPGPETGVCDRAEAAWVATVARTLPERQRTVLAVRASGADGSETAARLHLSYKAVESAMSRARASLRVALAGTLAILVAVQRRWQAATTPAVGAISVVAVGSVVSVTAGVVPARPVPQPPAVVVVAPPAASAPGVVRGAAGKPAGATVTVTGVRRPAPVPRTAVAPADPEPTETDKTSAGEGTPAGGVTLTAEQYDEDESAVESVERCLREGVAVSRRIVGCRPRGSG